MGPDKLVEGARGGGGGIDQNLDYVCRLDAQTNFSLEYTTFVKKTDFRI